MKRPGGEWKVVQFNYEWLGVLCFLCGILSNVEQFCPNLFDMEEDEGVRLWGASLWDEILRGGLVSGRRWLQEGGPVEADQLNTAP